LLQRLFAGANHPLSRLNFHAREAAAALLKMARATSDPALAARLIERAADIKDQAGELPQAPAGLMAPDIQRDPQAAEHGPSPSSLAS
jgi:hypothetical protein